MLRYISQPLVGITLATSLLLNACSEPEKRATGPQAVPVKLQTLKDDNLINSSEYVGTLEARQRVNLAFRTNGRIAKIFVEEGTQVKQGQPIAELEPTQQRDNVSAAVGQVNISKANLSNAEARLRQIQAERDATQTTIAQRKADIAGAKASLLNREAEISSREADLRESIANVALAQKNYERAGFLVNEGAQAQQDLDDRTRALAVARANVDSRRKQRDAAIASRDQARAQIQAAQEAYNNAVKNVSAADQQVGGAAANVNSQRASVSQAQAQLGSISQDLAFTTLKAPISGIVGSFLQKKEGDFISTGEVLTTLTNNEAFNLNISIPTEYQNQLRVGLPVEAVNADNKPGVRGQITFISPNVNQNTQSILTKVTFLNDGSLRNDQYVKVRVIWDEKPGVLVPTTAVTSLGGQKFVFVAEKAKTPEGKESLVARQKPIQVGTIQGQAYQVVGGIKPGEKVVLTRILDLRNGSAIADESILQKQAVEQ
jgi:RND family efflux transporter MFP subunit